MADSAADTSHDAATPNYSLRILTNVERSKATSTCVGRTFGTITFATWVKRWRAGVVGLRSSTLPRDNGYVDPYLLPCFEHSSLADIDHAAIRTWIAQLVRSPHC